jgi:hypothetical protein
MLPDRLHAVTVTLERATAQTRDATTGLPTAATSTSTLTVQEEPWRPDATPPRPDGLTAEQTRLYVARVEVRGADESGTASGLPPDVIERADGSRWRVREVIAAPGLGPIPAAWHAYCIRIEPGDEP